MRWFRSNRRFGGRLALLALAVQLFLSFGHIHHEDIFGPARPGAAAALVAQAAADQANSTPADHPSKHPDDTCAICATISLLSNSFVAAAPQLPLPVVVHAVEHTDHVVVVAVIATRRAPFQSRAPPIA
jgi:hypothetical protein